MKVTKQLREYQRAAERHGVTVVSATRGRHVHLLLQCGVHQKMFVIACTSGDVRGIHNFDSMVKRWASECQNLLT